MGETGVWSLGQEDPLEEGMTTHSGIFAWEIPWREEPGGLQSMGLQRVRHDWATNTFFTRDLKTVSFSFFHLKIIYLLYLYICWARSLDVDFKEVDL